jgi:hypothetical protein
MLKLVFTLRRQEGMTREDQPTLTSDGPPELPE